MRLWYTSCVKEFCEFFLLVDCPNDPIRQNTHLRINKGKKLPSYLKMLDVWKEVNVNIV